MTGMGRDVPARGRGLIWGDPYGLGKNKKFLLQNWGFAYFRTDLGVTQTDSKHGNSGEESCERGTRDRGTELEQISTGPASFCLCFLPWVASWASWFSGPEKWPSSSAYGDLSGSKIPTYMCFSECEVPGPQHPCHLGTCLIGRSCLSLDTRHNDKCGFQQSCLQRVHFAAGQGSGGHNRGLTITQDSPVQRFSKHATLRLDRKCSHMCLPGLQSQQL